MFSNNKANADFTDKARAYGQDKLIVEAVCLSTDTKPTEGIANGSLCLEMDTGKFYGFDASANDWIEIEV